MRKTIPVRRPAVNPNSAALNTRLESSAARFHVGSNGGFASLTGQSAAADGTRQVVDISAGGKSWQYPAQVKNGQWLLPMPFFLIEDWQAGKLTVTVR